MTSENQEISQMPTEQPPGLTCYVIYKNPIDYPGKFVTRKWIGLCPKIEPEIVGDTLYDARRAVPVGLYCLPRFDADDPSILEVWI